MYIKELIDVSVKNKHADLVFKKTKQEEENQIKQKQEEILDAAKKEADEGGGIDTSTEDFAF